MGSHHSSDSMALSTILLPWAPLHCTADCHVTHACGHVTRWIRGWILNIFTIIFSPYMELLGDDCLLLQPLWSPCPDPTTATSSSSQVTPTTTPSLTTTTSTPVPSPMMSTSTLDIVVGVVITVVLVVLIGVAIM